MSAPSASGASVLRCPVIFDGTNYCDWVPRMRLHMRGLRLWEFLTGELRCPPCPTAPTQPVITEKATDAEKTLLFADFADRQASYESRFSTYRAWLDEDARAGSILTASMVDRIAADIVDFGYASQMWAFLRDRYEPTGQSTYLAAIRQEQLLRQGDSTVEDFFAQISAIWRQLDTLGPQLSPDTSTSCRGQRMLLSFDVLMTS
jgi:hypothetical protein